MFNLTVDEAHTFYVGVDGWLVYNGIPCFTKVVTNDPNVIKINKSAEKYWQDFEGNRINPRMRDVYDCTGFAYDLLADAGSGRVYRITPGAGSSGLKLPFDGELSGGYNYHDVFKMVNTSGIYILGKIQYILESG